MRMPASNNESWIQTFSMQTLKRRFNGYYSNEVSLPIDICLGPPIFRGPLIPKYDENSLLDNFQVAPIFEKMHCYFFLTKKIFQFPKELNGNQENSKGWQMKIIFRASFQVLPRPDSPKTALNEVFQNLVIMVLLK